MSKKREVFFKMKNYHISNCGEPPDINNDDENKYFGYYENHDHEQLVFVYDYETNTAMVRMGDVGWGTHIDVKNGAVDGYVLSPGERAWIQLCWDAATRYISDGNKESNK